MKSFVDKIILILFVGLALPLHADQVLLIKVSPEKLGKRDVNQGMTGVHAVDAVLSRHGVERVFPVFSSSTFDIIPELQAWSKVIKPDGDDIYTIVADLQSLASVEYAGENRVLQLDANPNDPRYSDQWALATINAPQAWDVETGSANVPIAIIDTGVDYLHEDLAANIWVNSLEDLNNNGVLDESDQNGIDDDGNGYIDDVIGWDFTDAPNYPDGGDYLDRDADPMDEYGHGTGVAGIVAATADNHTGIAGVAYDCRIMALRAFTASGYGEEDDVASAILYAVANGARVINMSWGDVFVTRLIQDVVQYAAGQGVVLVASAGNSSTDAVHYPSGFPETISVGSTDQEDELSSFSNYGALVDLTAPGSDILTTDLDDDYNTMNGTSFSAPFVSAAAGLLLSLEPDLSPETVKARLLNSADDLGASGIDPYFRAGRLNLYTLLGDGLPLIARIDQPYLDAGIHTSPVDIVGSAWGAAMQKYSLSYGQGANPNQWTVIEEVENTRVLDGLLGQWRDLPDAEGEYALKVEVTGSDGSVAEGITRVFMDQSAPEISGVELQPMLDGDRNAVLVSFTTDDLCEGSIFYRPQGSSAEFSEIALDYRTHTLRYLLTQDISIQNLEIKLRAVNGSGLVTVDDNNGSFYQADLDLDPVHTNLYTPGRLQTPFGHLLNKTWDYNSNGIPELIISADASGNIGSVQFWEYSVNGMVMVAELAEDRIPRDLADVTGDGVPELLCGFGFSSYIYTVPDGGQFPTESLVEFEGGSDVQYWASRFSDADNDAISELVMRIVDNDGDRFQVLEWSGSAFESVADLDNPTDGENMNGVPHAEIGDFDHDGLTDILLGDNDGDIYIYENTSDNHYQPVWNTRLPLQDAIDFIHAGDFDGDGITEFIAGCHSDPSLNTEYEYDARYWYYAVFDMSANNEYTIVQDWRFYGFESVRDFPAGVTSGDTDGDGLAEIIISAFPDLYMIEYTPDAEYRIAWHHSTASGNNAIIVDADNDGSTELFIGDGKTVASYQAVGGNTGPAVPAGLSAFPQNANSVSLSWRSVQLADEYIIYRGTDPAELDHIANTQESTWMDTDVQAGELYWYAVQTVSSQYNPTASLLSAPVSAKPGNRPFVQGAVQVSDRAIRLHFNEIMGPSVKAVSAYDLESMGRPASVAVDASGASVLLTWAGPFSRAGDYTLACKSLYDADRTPLDSTRNSTIVSIHIPKSVPYLVDGVLEGNMVMLTFSENMDRASVENTQHYDLGAGIEVLSAILDDDRYVQLDINSEHAFGVSDSRVDIKVSNVKSSQNVMIQVGRGDRLSLLFSAADLSHVITFPNPWQPNLGVTGVSFANLTQNAEIRIMTETGVTVRVLNENDGDGGVLWDLKNENGEPVASGIYIYGVKNDKQRIQGKLAIVR